MIGGRRIGKTTLALVELMQAALKYPDAVCWYIGPTLKAAKRNVWEKLKKLAAPVMTKKHETELYIDFPNGSRIQIFGAEEPEALRGEGLRLVVLDEFALHAKLVWQEIVRPMLSDTGGRALFISTPRGFNWAYDLYQSAAAFDAEKDPEWGAFQFTTLEGGRVPIAEIEAAKRDMTDKQFAQEYLARFEALTGRIYDQFSDENVRVIKDNGEPLIIGVDFNVNPMTAVVGKDIGGELHILDCIEIMTSNTYELADELYTRYKMWAPTDDAGNITGEPVGRELTVVPDPAGNHRRSSAASGMTDHRILENKGFIVDTDRAAPLVKDRFNAVNTLIHNADKQRALFVHPRAIPVLKTLWGHTYKPGTSQPTKSTGKRGGAGDAAGLDHAGDALGYMIWRRFNRVQEGWSQTQAEY